MEDNSVGLSASAVFLENLFPYPGSSQRDYSTEQLVQSIEQKYYPPANHNQINSVLSNLADRIDRVATITNHHSPDVQVTMWQSRNRYNYLHGIADDDEASWHRYRPRI